MMARARPRARPDLRRPADAGPLRFGPAATSSPSSSPVATQIPHAAGIAYAAKLRKTGAVAMTCFGEGGSSKGDFHEACNFAGDPQVAGDLLLREQPLRDLGSARTSRWRSSTSPIARSAYGFPGVDRRRHRCAGRLPGRQGGGRSGPTGEGPTLVEAKVYRFQPHTSDDDDRTYRDPDEVKAWRARDPLALVRSAAARAGRARRRAKSPRSTVRYRREVDARDRRRRTALRSPTRRPSTATSMRIADRSMTVAHTVR